MLKEYRKGMRVATSPEGLAALGMRHGTVVGRGRGGNCVVVVLDGHSPKTRSTIHMSFLDPAIIDSNVSAAEDRISL